MNVRREGAPERTAPVNQRVVFLEALGHALREKGPDVRAHVAMFRSGVPPLLPASCRDTHVRVGCDLGRDGWHYTWGFDPTAVIAATGDTARAARIVADATGAGRR